MDDQQILAKAIQKAIEGGWKEPDDELAAVVFGYGEWGDINRLEEHYEQWGTVIEARGLKDVIFNHDFAKALWGEHVPADPTPPIRIDWIKKGRTMTLRALDPKNIGWQYHLQQMVIADDPIKYLGENLPD